MKLAGMLVLCIIVACAEGSIEPDIAVDAGALDAATTKTFPTEPPRAKDAGHDARTGDDDDDAPDDFFDAGPPKPPPPYKYRIFITKERFSANLGGLEGADDKCMQAAAAANLTGGKTWKAWVSTTKENAGARIEDRAPWYLVDRATVVFKSFASLSLPPHHPISRNETGALQVFGLGPTGNRVWTGTDDSGALTVGKNCSDWTDAALGKRGSTGANVETAGSLIAESWTRYAIQPEEGCSKRWPIYCFEQ